MDERTLELLVRDNRLVVDEIELFKAVVKWGTAQCQKHGEQPTGSNVRPRIASMVPYIRFPLMTADELATFVMDTGAYGPWI